VPVLLGTIGGAALVIGWSGLASAEGRGLIPDLATRSWIAKDYGPALGGSSSSGDGLGALALRTTAVYPTLLLVHLSAVFVCFAVAPATKFVHLFYRFLALGRDRMELTDATGTDT